jgi:hypothetical protein
MSMLGWSQVTSKEEWGLDARENLEALTQIDGSWLWNADPNGRSSGRRTGLLKALSLVLQHWFLVLVFMIDCKRCHVRDVTEIPIY